MKPTIKITKAVASIWKKELTNIADCTAKTGITYKTIIRARDKRVCTQDIANRINIYILQERDRKKKLNRSILSK